MAEVFRSNEKRVVDASIGRLCVLYEDLRIELFAIKEDSIPCIDVLDPAKENAEAQNIGKYRRNYFLRRAVGTLSEFAEGLRLLNACPDFTQIKSAFDSENTQLWDDAAEFFRREENAIRRVRDDIGGHFGSQAAIYAVGELRSKMLGKIEFTRDPPDARLNFVVDIAAAAFFRHLPGLTAEEKTATFMNEVLTPGWRHSTYAVQALIAFYLWPRFGR